MEFGFHGMYEGFLLPLLASFVRCYNDTYQHQLLVEQAENLNAIYDALNYLSSCPWQINTRVRKAVVCCLVCLLNKILL